MEIGELPPKLILDPERSVHLASNDLLGAKLFHGALFIWVRADVSVTCLALKVQNGARFQYPDLWPELHNPNMWCCI